MDKVFPDLRLADPAAGIAMTMGRLSDTADLPVMENRPTMPALAGGKPRSSADQTYHGRRQRMESGMAVT
jgi:hypothetical protein